MDAYGTRGWRQTKEKAGPVQDEHRPEKEPTTLSLPRTRAEDNEEGAVTWFLFGFLAGSGAVGLLAMVAVWR